MYLKEKLNEFLFNLETAQLLQSFGRTDEQITNEMTNLHFSDSLLHFEKSSYHLYHSVMLRLRLYSENNFSEEQVRTSLSVLNNDYVNDLLNYLYSTNSLVQPNVSQNVSSTVPPTVSSAVPPTNQLVNKDDDTNVESEDENNPFETFFDSCVKQTEESTDIVKGSDFYQAFSEWWEGKYNNIVPIKKELKNYLNTKLGKSNRSTWTNVVLSN